jgi:hypothetical protein
MLRFISFFQAMNCAKRFYQGLRFANSGEAVHFSTTGAPGAVVLSWGLYEYRVFCADLAGFIERLGGHFEAFGGAYLRMFALARAAHIYGVDFSKLYQYRNRF